MKRCWRCLQDEAVPGRIYCQKCIDECALLGRHPAAVPWAAPTEPMPGPPSMPEPPPEGESGGPESPGNGPVQPRSGAG